METRRPPHLVLQFFRWYCDPDIQGYVEGDLMEVYERRLTRQGKRIADLKLALDILLLFRPGIIRPIRRQKNSTNYGMIRSYFKIAWRNLLRNRAYSIINISGLALGIACFIFLLSYVRFERSYEDFHKNADNIYRVTLNLYKGSEFLMTDCEMFAPVGPLLKEKMPEVTDFVRMMNNDNRMVKIGQQKFLEEQSYFADSTALTIFSLKALDGTLTGALSRPNQTILTASAARKYFGRTDVVNESLESVGGVYKITCVIEDLPPNTHLKFDYLLSHVTFPKIATSYTDQSWESGNNEFLYLLMSPGTNLAAFNKKLTTLSSGLKDKIGESEFSAEAIKDIHLYSHKTFEPDVNGNASTVYGLLIIAIFIIGLAWINYINLSTAKAIERAREVGVRKVMGSLRSQLMIQFLVESIAVNMIAGIIALLLLRIGSPYFRELTGQPLTDVLHDSGIWVWFAIILFIGVFFSGGYPAIILSSFEPAAVLKSKFSSSTHGQWMRKGLVVFQFTATSVLVICLVTVYLQIKHLQNYDLGMDISQSLVLRAPDQDQADSIHQSKGQSFMTELLRDPNIQIASLSQSVPGLGVNEMSTSGNIVQLGKDQSSSFNYYHYAIDANFIPVFGMQLIAGRNFENGMSNQDLVLVNEEAAKSLGFESPEQAIGSRITYYTRWPGESSTVIGVLKDFYQRSPKENKVPMIFRYHSRMSRYITIKVKQANVKETIDRTKQAWDKLFPSSPYSYFFLDEKYNQQYKSDAQFGQVMASFSSLAIIIACLGLFGLSSFTILQRTKEIGIRKILGGSVIQIVQLLSRDFIKWVLLGVILAIPLGYFVVEQWLSAYPVRISLSAWIFLVPMLIMLFISMATVSIQTINAANGNPIKSLRAE